MNKKRSVITALVVTGLIATSTTSAFAHDGKGKWGRGQHGGGAVNSLVTAGTITQSQADTFSAEMKTKLDAKFATKLNTVLSDLVSKSSITQAKADSIKSASTSKRGLRQLIRAGTVTSVEANLIRDGLRALPKEDVTTIRDQVLSNLVSNNTITQAQADAIKAAKQSWVKKLGRHRGADLGTAQTAALTF